MQRPGIYIYDISPGRTGSYPASHLCCSLLADCNKQLDIYQTKVHTKNGLLSESRCTARSLLWLKLLIRRKQNDASGTHVGTLCSLRLRVLHQQIYKPRKAYFLIRPCCIEDLEQGAENAGNCFNGLTVLVKVIECYEARSVYRAILADILGLVQNRVCSLLTETLLKQPLFHLRAWEQNFNRYCAICGYKIVDNATDQVSNDFRIGINAIKAAMFDADAAAADQWYVFTGHGSHQSTVTPQAARQQQPTA